VLAAIAGCAAKSDADDPALVPPLLGEDSIEAWFAEGHYQAWTCEAMPHAAIAPSPHGVVRQCINPIAELSTGDVQAIDASLVLEIVDAGGAVVGHGAMRHTRGGMDPEDWYWYMHVPADNATTHDATGLAADGWGFEGPPMTYCGACHQAAPGGGLVFVGVASKP
jgi:hypothetical protein